MNTELDLVQLVNQTAKQVSRFVSEIESLYMYRCPDGCGIERRETERLNITMPVRIIPLTDNMAPRVYESNGITRNISSAGVGLVSPDPLSESYLILEFQPIELPPFSIIGKTLYCIETGFYFQIGCEFLNWETLL